MKEANARKRNILLFVVCSLIGIVLFLVPININGSSDLLIARIADGITAVIKPGLPLALSLVFGIFTLLAIIHYFKPLKFLTNSTVLGESYNSLTPLKLAMQVIGTVCFILCAMGGPEFITSAATGGTMYGLVLSLFAWHIISFYLFCFLMDFGAMDFVGTLVTKIMRPVFKLPGNSAIDCMASWVGNGPFGVIITKMQYQEGYYTKREAAVVATCFSIVSISFCTVVAKTLNILDHFSGYYLCLTVITLLCAFILPRTWPLKNVEKTYNPDAPKRYDIVIKGGLFKRAVDCAADKAGEVSFRHLLKRSTVTAVDFIITVFPTMMAYGTILLVISEYTPIMHYISLPFEWYLNLFNLPEAAAAAPCMLIGFVDMFLPAAAGSTITCEMTRFVIGCVSIAQLIYMTETGSIIIKNKNIFCMSIGKLFLMFIFRTIIAIPISIMFAYLIF